MREIDIDFDVHKMIEAERRSFDEPPIAALRRLLGLPEATSQPSASSAPPPRDGWHGEVFLESGTRLRMAYNGRRYEGRIDGEKWIVNGRAWHSPSGAASGVAITKNGESTRLDGWNYWEVLPPGETEWIGLKTLRRKEGWMRMGSYYSGPKAKGE